ncbi:MAG: rhomboid family intramembrane serine protease, partial [Chloroflexi bacterium]|nr:rhomboid family intramembrane serine protease [Chloroflexota bacterium]
PPAPAGYRVPAVRPRLTYLIMGLTILVFLGQLAGQSLLGYDLLVQLGLKVNSLIVAGQYWRLITPIFLHAGLLHIGFNMYALYVLGPQVEGPFGHTRFGLLYFLSGSAGVVLSLALSPYPSLGASGAIFGLIGALVVYLYRHREAFGSFGRRRLTSIVYIAVLNLAIGFTPGIDNWGHLGGLLGGAAVAWLIGPNLTLEYDYTSGRPAVVDRSALVSRLPETAMLCLGLLAVTVAVIFYRS